ncbi:MAG: hypothetical protein E7F72_08415 [Haemophilus parainfluenzae]|jgi:hypothetical protein|nr:hypothetical protein [Haemophilus parainfluenzae]
MTQFVTPDLAMSRDEVEAIVRTYAPEGFAALGLDRLLTTAQMVREFEAGNLEDEELCALLPHFGYYYTGTRRKVDTSEFDWMELLDFHAVAEMIRAHAPGLLSRLGLERLCTVRRIAEEYRAGNVSEDQLITLCAHYDMGIYTLSDPANWLDISVGTLEGNYSHDLELARDDGLITWELYEAIEEASRKVMELESE